MRHENWIESELEKLTGKGLLRSLTPYPAVGGKMAFQGKTFLNFSSNDYLDFARRPEVAGAALAALERYGCGATASRLISGTLEAHDALERGLAELKGYPEALLFGSGFLANVGVIPALAGREDHVFADKLVHASIIDGLAVSRTNVVRFRHNDPEHLETLLKKRPPKGRALVVTESVFSMDGDIAPLEEITRIAMEYGAMVMVDEAHATGVFGPSGSGLVGEYGLEERVNVSMGTLSKGLGGYGGFVACSSPMRNLLVNRARGLIYTTGLPPAVAGAGLGALDVLKREPGLGARLLANAGMFREKLRNAGFDVGDSQTQIIPLMIGENTKALDAALKLKERGILAVAVRPPTVPEGTARLRLSVTLAHTPEDLAWAAETIAAVLTERAA